MLGLLSLCFHILAFLMLILRMWLQSAIILQSADIWVCEIIWKWKEKNSKLRSLRCPNIPFHPSLNLLKNLFFLLKIWNMCNTQFDSLDNQAGKKGEVAGRGLRKESMSRYLCITGGLFWSSWHSWKLVMQKTQRNQVGPRKTPSKCETELPAATCLPVSRFIYSIASFFHQVLAEYLQCAKKIQW